MIHMFFSEREAFKIPDIPKETSIKEIKTASVIGCGTMGGSWQLLKYRYSCNHY